MRSFLHEVIMIALGVHGLKSLRAKIAIPFAILVILAILVAGFIAEHQAIKTPCWKKV
jgi:hypothetical protein